MTRYHSWITSSKCVICDKTGKVPDTENPGKEKKCLNCGGDGYTHTRGRTKAD